MKRLVVFFALGTLVVPLSIHAQEGWVRVVGGAEDDQGYGFQSTEDGGCMVVGWTESFGNGKHDLWLIRFDSLGDTLWTKIYGGPENDEGYCIEKTPDSCLIVTGMTESYGSGSKDLWLLKVNLEGDTLWSKTYGDEYNDWGKCVQNTTDNGFILTGTKSVSDYCQQLWIIKTDSQGNALWSKTHGAHGGYDAHGNWGQQTTDGGYILTGSSKWDLWLLKTDSVGDTLWSKTYAEPIRNDEDIGYFIKQESDNCFKVCGKNGWDGNVWFLSVDSLGDTTWARTYYSGGSCMYDAAYNFGSTSDGGYILIGEMVMAVMLLKVDSLGTKQWIRQWTIPGYGYHVTENQDGGFTVSGSAKLWESWKDNREVLLIKTDSNGYFREELTPTRSIVPEAGDSIDSPLTPRAFFTYLANSRYHWLMPPFRYFCEIRNLGQEKVVYKDTIYISEYDPEYDPEEDDYESWESKEIEFSKWYADTTGEYSITFSFDTLFPGTWPKKSRPLTVNFFVSSTEPGIAEQPIIGGTSSWVVLVAVGSRIVLSYNNSPGGFSAAVFDATGRKVDELHSTQPEDIISWGDGFSHGVYFIVVESNTSKQARKVILIK